MSELPIFAVTGEKKTGKTTLICRFIEELKERGLEVASIKHTRGDHSLDEEGSDSWKHGEAGSDIVVFSTPVETCSILKEENDLEQIIDIIRCIGDPDIVLIEGMKDEDIPHIDISEEIDCAEDISEDLFEDMLERIEREIEMIDILNDLPGLDCGNCGYDSCRGLAEAVKRGEAAKEECEQKISRLDLTVNDKEIHLGRFPTKVIINGIEGMISSLKGVEEIRSIEIDIKEDVGTKEEDR